MQTTPRTRAILFLSTPSARRATIQFGLPALINVGDFYPRPPRGGRRSSLSCRPPTSKFLSTPSARRATTGKRLMTDAEGISIHALREEGDPEEYGVQSAYHQYFYPHPPRGGRQNRIVVAGLVGAFLSTPSARRATIKMPRKHLTHDISIHALREEGDQCWQTSVSKQYYFYPRPPRGGRLRRCGGCRA